ncbi:MAG: HAD-IA family hydrolase [Proteobacteria bacterium]|nr:HAD-IA family hydrolase [Pseudomonadota bacterium]
MTTTRQFDLIVFDWDGTLFDSTAIITRSIQAAAADLGLPVPSDRDASYVIGMGLVEALQHAVPALPRERYRELAERYRHHYFSAAHRIVFFDGIVAMLQALRARGHLLAVATGKSRAGLDAALDAAVDGALLRGLFDASRTADETASKPHPRMLLELMEQLVVAPERTLMIGDTTHDLQLAANAGAASIGVSYGAHDHAAFAGFDTRFVAHTVPELHGWLVRHG